MYALKGIGLFLLYVAIFIALTLAGGILLLLLYYLSTLPFFSSIANLYNAITRGAFDLLPISIGVYRCVVAYHVLNSIANRFSAKVSLFVFSIFLIIVSAYALFQPGEKLGTVVILAELITGIVLSVNSYKSITNREE